MGKVAFFSYPFFGHVNPTADLVRELVERGEQVYYYSTDPYLDYISMEGVICRSYGDLTGLLNDEIPIHSSDPLEIMRILVPRKLREHQRMAQLLMRRVMEDEPDYIIRDCEAYWGKMIGCTLEIPVICFITTIALNEEIMDGQTDYFARHVLGTPLEGLSSRPGGSRFSDYLNECTRELSRPYSIEYKAIDAFSGADAFNLVFTSREFQPFADTFGSDYLFLGPSIRKAEEGPALPKPPGSPPLVYISMGTVYNDCLPFYRKCIDAFRDSSWQVMMSIGKHIPVEELGDIPDHIRVGSHMPQIRILQQADVFITHGGHNSASEALYYEVPMVMFPQAADQFAVSGRIQEIGAGLAGSSRDSSPEEIASMARQVLDDPAFRHSCRQAGQAIRASGGAGLAVDGIFAFLNRAALHESMQE
ncbi:MULTISPECIES: macrolide family glycosyltransferase [unclassified Paenibacillus]|uniref:macrolide family glycosyltransferase n=1 Tax=unclassified Paenibacillus TaxID=185978 RepID=UPI000954052D|nr:MULTISPECIES: macrolide family glycosyltransferase [unclassified Paenibacillus]ASS65415.1 hypothetical protein CIC07_04210 [Paenibacillus sp. RUD330]SIQ37028.1 glycosyltransferase, MGT family [Paenibacillus sp. RU4X]SIQ59119.1 glycosyltransferase, MGT family [Paenibacillus sp. RU4T]